MVSAVNGLGLLVVGGRRVRPAGGGKLIGSAWKSAVRQSEDFSCPSPKSRSSAGAVLSWPSAKSRSSPGSMFSSPSAKSRSGPFGVLLSPAAKSPWLSSDMWPPLGVRCEPISPWRRAHRPRSQAPRVLQRPVAVLDDAGDRLRRDRPPEAAVVGLAAEVAGEEPGALRDGDGLGQLADGVGAAARVGLADGAAVADDEPVTEGERVTRPGDDALDEDDVGELGRRARTRGLRVAPARAPPAARHAAAPWRAAPGGPRSRPRPGRARRPARPRARPGRRRRPRS